MSESDEKQDGEDAPKAPKIEPNELTQEQNNRIVRYINERAASENDECPVCQSPVNTVTPLTFVMDVEPIDGALASGRNMPLYVTMCHNCGFTRLFNRLLVDRHIREEDLAAEAKSEEDTSDGS